MRVFISIFLLIISISGVSETFSKEEIINPVTKGKIWIYLPNNKEEKIPVVLIPPAGTRLFHGIEVSESDSTEHLPYVESGFGVISYDISGSWPFIETDFGIYTAIESFLNSNAGVNDTKQALEVALKKYNRLDSNEVYIAGHSSAGTLALMAAKQMPEIDGVIAFAPILNLELFLMQITEELSPSFPKFKSALIDKSPHKEISKFKAPIFLFSAKDDSHLKGQEKSYKIFLQSISEKGLNIQHKQVDTGGHYQSMIRDGIPAAIKWLKKLNE